MFSVAAVREARQARASLGAIWPVAARSRALSLLYSLTFNLPQAWQVGSNPTISYNDKASSENRWDVPVGLFAAKTIKLGRVPFKIQVGMEYSVVSPDAFGKCAAFQFVLTPVIPGLVNNPIFGGS